MRIRVHPLSPFAGFATVLAPVTWLVFTPQVIAQPDCVAPPLGLVNWWRGEGDALDSVGDIHGTQANGVGFAPGRVGQAFSFDGLNDAITNTVPGLTNIRRSFTMEFWAFPNAGRASTPETTSGLAGISGQRYAIFPHYGNNTVQGAGVSVGTNGVSVFEHGITYLPSLLVYNAPIIGWTHIAVIYENQQSRLYVNGVLVRVGLTSAGTACPSTWLGAGGQSPSLNYGHYAGLLDEVSIYDRPLSPAEIQAVFNAGIAGKCASPTVPHIISQPDDQYVTAGTDVTFHVTAGGTPPLSYQWRFNGDNIAGATESSLALINVQVNQTGNYSVVVTNLIGSTTSSNAFLAVDQLPPCAPIPMGLVNWWRGEGDALDSVGDIHGTQANGVGFASGQVGQAFSFDGLNDAITNTVPGLTNILRSFTMEFWALPNAGRVSTPEATAGLTGISGQRYAIFPHFGDTAVKGVGVSVGTNGVSVFEHANTYIPSVLVYNTPITGWTHIAVVYENHQPRLYINGVLVRVGLISTGPPVCPSTWLGAGGQSPSLNYGHYAGLLDEVSIYDRSLSPVEIQALYDGGKAGKCVNHPPVADAGATVTPLIIPAGCPSIAVLDASRSSDSDGDTLHYFWFKTGDTSPFAAGVVSEVTLPLGQNSITLVVDDGVATNAHTFILELITPAQAIERLLALVNSQATNPDPLAATLSAARASIQRGHVTPALNQLEAFKHQVRAQVLPDRPELAASFTGAAQQIIDAISQDCASAGRIAKAQREVPGQVKMEFSATSGGNYWVEASTNLVDWERVGVAVERKPGQFEFEDPDAAQFPMRFYRIAR